MTDEVGHLAVGKRWFDYVYGMNGLDPVRNNTGLSQYFHGDLKPPFNIAARHAAKFSSVFWATCRACDLIASTR